MKILALDLGITTGYAVFDSDLEVNLPVEYGEIKDTDLEYRLKQLKLAYLVTHSVCERPVIIRGKLGSRLEELLSIVRVQLDHQVQFVDPAQWKPTPWGKATTPPKLSTHARDAIRLGLWYRASLQKDLQGR